MKYLTLTLCLTIANASHKFQKGAKVEGNTNPNGHPEWVQGVVINKGKGKYSVRFEGLEKVTIVCADDVRAVLQKRNPNRLQAPNIYPDQDRKVKYGDYIQFDALCDGTWVSHVCKITKKCRSSGDYRVTYVEVSSIIAGNKTMMPEKSFKERYEQNEKMSFEQAEEKVFKDRHGNRFPFEFAEFAPSWMEPHCKLLKELNRVLKRDADVNEARITHLEKEDTTALEKEIAELKKGVQMIKVLKSQNAGLKVENNKLNQENTDALKKEIAELKEENRRLLHLDLYVDAANEM